VAVLARACPIWVECLGHQCRCLGPLRKMPQARPAGPSNFPSNISRPSGNIGSMPGNMSRPMPGNIQRPSTGNSMNTNRPSLGGSMPTTRPAPGGISNITPPSNLTRPAPGNLGGQSPSTRPNIKLPGSSGSLTRPAPGGIGSGNMPTTRPAPLPGTGGPSLGGISRPPNQGGIGTNRLHRCLASQDRVEHRRPSQHQASMATDQISEGATGQT